MIEVTTGSRLHFGLFQPGAVATSGSLVGRNATGHTSEPLVATGERRFGGAGMMIDQPGLRLRAAAASAWAARGPLADRALALARRCAERLQEQTGVSVLPQEIVIEAAAPEHAGLGTGTQLGMAVARVVAEVAGRPDLSTHALATLAERGRRSGVGIHGFERGGFLVDGGQRSAGEVSPLVAWSPVPAEWRVVLVHPSGDRGWHGPREQASFDELKPFPHTDHLCRLVLLGLLPALQENDLDAFGEALFELNRRAGEAFSAAQGGLYAGPGVAEAVGILRTLGVTGVGQSSWGPTVFGVVADTERAHFIASRIRERGALSDAVMVASPRNHGAIM